MDHLDLPPGCTRPVHARLTTTQLGPIMGYVVTMPDGEVVSGGSEAEAADAAWDHWSAASGISRERWVGLLGGEEARRDRALLGYMIARGVEIDQYLLDDPPLTEEQLAERRRLAEALDPGGDMPPPPDELTEGTIDRADLLGWLEREADAADMRCGFAPSRPGTALREAARWIRVAYRPPPSGR